MQEYLSVIVLNSYHKLMIYMRNKHRIPHLLGRLEQVWIKQPDLRLGQLITNVIGIYDIYNIEDETLIELLEKIYEES